MTLAHDVPYSKEVVSVKQTTIMPHDPTRWIAPWLLTYSRDHCVAGIKIPGWQRATRGITEHKPHRTKKECSEDVPRGVSKRYSDARSAVGTENSIPCGYKNRYTLSLY